MLSVNVSWCVCEKNNHAGIIHRVYYISLKKSLHDSFKYVDAAFFLPHQQKFVIVNELCCCEMM